VILRKKSKENEEKKEPKKDDKKEVERKTKEKEEKKEKKVSTYKHDSDEDNESTKSKNSRITGSKSLKPKDKKPSSKLGNESDEEDSRRVKSAPNITGIKKKDALIKENSVKDLLKQSSPGSIGRKTITKESKDINQDLSKMDTKRVSTDLSDKKPQERKYNSVSRKDHTALKPKEDLSVKSISIKDYPEENVESKRDTIMYKKANSTDKLFNSIIDKPPEKKRNLYRKK